MNVLKALQQRLFDIVFRNKASHRPADSTDQVDARFPRGHPRRYRPSPAQETQPPPLQLPKIPPAHDPGQGVYGKPATVAACCPQKRQKTDWFQGFRSRSEEHTSELQSRPHLVCRLLLEKKKKHKKKQD